MNKTVFPLVMAVLTACPVLFSCTEKEQEVPVENKIYEYRFELAGDDTRAYLNDDGVFWELNDHVGLFTPTESLEAAVNTDASPKTIDVQSSTPLEVGTKVYAYYPYVEGNTSVSASKVLFPAEQSGGSISAMPLAGIPAEVVTEGEYNGVIRFLNLGSVIDFRVFSLTYAGETVESVTLQAGENSNIAGTATIDLTAVSWNDEKETATIPSLNWAEGAGSTTVTLTQSAPVAADKNAAIAGGHLYMVVAPGTYSGTITVTTNAARYTFPFTNQTFKQNGLKRFNMNLDSDSAVREAFSKTYVYAESISEGTYVIGAYETAGTYICLFPNISNNLCNHKLISPDGKVATITSSDPEVLGSEVEITSLNNNWLVKVKDNGQYMYYANGGFSFTTDASVAEQSITMPGGGQGYWVMNNVNSDTSYQLYHSSSNKGFLYASNKNADNLRFFRLAGLSQTLAFSETELAYDLASGDPFVEPTLTGAKTTVIYGTSNPDIAAVDAISGEVTFNENHRTGTVTITATAAGMDGYASAEATYTITVTDSDKPVVTYYKASILESGYDYLIVSGGMALKNAGNGEIVDAESVTVENDQITREEDPALLWTAADAPELDNYYYGTHTLTSGTEHLWRHSNNGNYTVEGSNASVTKYMIWSYEAEKLWNISVYEGNSSTYYTYYDNGWKSVKSSSAPTVKTNIFTARPPQTLSFSPTTAEYDLYTPGAFVKPTLSGYQTTVTYDSSDKTVATVDADGTVHPHSVGTTTITATAAGTAEYQGATATYELTVINSNLPTYVKADEVESGKAYLIVSNGNVLVNKNGSAAVAAVTVSGGQIKYDAPETALWTATVSSGSITFANGSNKLGRSSSSISLSTSASFSYDSENEYLTTKSSSTSTNTYYLYCTTSFRYSKNSAQNAALYVLDDGRQAQEISFSAADAEYDLGTRNWTKATPALTGAKTTVTYASSDETVATVANDGTVTPHKVGTTTITATASADAQYKKATASYTLSVVNSAVVEKTYNRVSSISAGTYLIMGRETDETRIGTYVCVFPPIADNKCDHIKVSDNKDLATLTTTSNEYGAYEVELIASGSNWLVKVKSSGQYMYYASSKISFTDDASVAAQQITSNSGYPACIKNTNDDQFYHSGSNTCFMYAKGKGANNLRFFKLSE